VSYRRDPGDPGTLLRHFSGIVKAGPAEPPTDRPEPRTRDFRYPDDLEVFFHSWCAPRAKLPEKLQDEIARLFAEAFLADYRKTIGRWARLGQPPPGEGGSPIFRAHVASTRARRVFTMARGDWQLFRNHEGKLIELDVERTPTAGVAEYGAAIAGLAADCSVHTERIEVWRYNKKEPPSPHNIQDYLVLENLTRRINLAKFAERVSTQDTPNLRKHLREHVFLVKARPDKGRWELKARALERIVFLGT